MRQRTIIPAALLVMAALVGCTPIFRPGGGEALPEAKVFASYAFDPASALEDRVAGAPEFILSYLRGLDSDPSYSSHAPSAEEKALTAEYLALLPPLNQVVLKERLLGLYFIEGLQGSGLTDFVDGPGGRLYYFMALNPAVLSMDISEWVTLKENTCFARDSEAITVTIDLGREFKGLMYILLHESTHAVDYTLNITPFVEPGMRDVPRDGLGAHPFVNGIWNWYAEPVASADFALRDSVTFYGWGGGPSLGLTEALRAYQGLSASPFVSLYASRNWAEDLAELITFYHLKDRMGTPYSIRYEDRAQGFSFTLKPMSNPSLVSRLAITEVFYTPDGVP